MANMLPRRALSGVRLAALGATQDFTTGSEGRRTKWFGGRIPTASTPGNEKRSVNVASAERPIASRDTERALAQIIELLGEQNSLLDRQATALEQIASTLDDITTGITVAPIAVTVADPVSVKTD